MRFDVSRLPPWVTNQRIKWSLQFHAQIRNYHQGVAKTSAHSTFAKANANLKSTFLPSFQSCLDGQRSTVSMYYFYLFILHQGPHHTHQQHYFLPALPDFCFAKFIITFLLFYLQSQSLWSRNKQGKWFLSLSSVTGAGLYIIHSLLFWLLTLWSHQERIIKP